MGGPDAAFSLEPYEFSAMVTSVREAETALGKVSYDLTEKTIKSREFSRSLFVVNDIKSGEVFSEENVRSVRPGHGLAPVFINDVIDRKAVCDIKKGTPLTWEFVEGGRRSS